MSTNADRKIALITGSSRGLGRNMALHLVTCPDSSDHELLERSGFVVLA